MEGSSAEITLKYDQRIPAPAHRVAQQDLETRLIFQECQASHLPDHDNPQPLCLAVQYQENFLHGEVSKN